MVHYYKSFTILYYTILYYTILYYNILQDSELAFVEQRKSRRPIYISYIIYPKTSSSHRAFNQEQRSPL